MTVATSGFAGEIIEDEDVPRVSETMSRQEDSHFFPPQQSTMTQAQNTIGIRLLDDLKVEALALNSEMPMEVRAILGTDQFASDAASYVENFVPQGFMLGAITPQGDVKAYRQGFDFEAFPVPPAEVLPLKLRIVVYAESNLKLADRTLIAHYRNSMKIWPTVRDPFRLDALSQKMRDHVKAVVGMATKCSDDSNAPACAVYASTSPLNSTAVTSDPNRGSLSHQIVSVCIRLAKTDPDFQGQSLVKIYLPDQFLQQQPIYQQQQYPQHFPPSSQEQQQQQQQQQQQPIFHREEQQQADQQQQHPFFANNYQDEEQRPPSHAHHQSLPSHFFKSGKRLRLSGDLPPLPPQQQPHHQQASSLSTVVVHPPARLTDTLDQELNQEPPRSDSNDERTQEEHPFDQYFRLEEVDVHLLRAFNAPPPSSTVSLASDFDNLDSLGDLPGHSSPLIVQ